jgi:hypothetical protein
VRIKVHWQSIVLLIPLIPFFLLPLYPLGYAVIAVGLGLWRWVIHKESSNLKWFFLIFAALGVLSQLLAPPVRNLDPSLSLSPNPPLAATTAPPTNLIPPFGLNCLFAWNQQDGAYLQKERLPDGFFRLPRTHPVSGRQFSEYLCERQYPLETGQVYTQSFLLRHDGNSIDVQISFATDRGHNPVTTRISHLGNGLKQVYATYKAQPGDRAVRAVDFFNMGGDWTYLEVGFAQLELGPAPTPYRPGKIVVTSPADRVGWWIGTALMGFLLLLGSRWLLSITSTPAITSALLLGMAVHMGIALYQYIEPREIMDRAQGLTIQPNLLGHLSIASLGLIWLISNSPLITRLAFAVAVGLVWVSGSRAALLGLLPLLAFGWSQIIARKYWLIFLGVVFATILLFWQLNWVGRLTDIVNLDATTNQSRMQIWLIAIQAWLHSPLTGVGLGNLSTFYQINLPLGALEFNAAHAHNLPLQLVSESGLLGLLGFLALWGVYTLRLFKLRAFRALALLLTLMILNLVDYTWFTVGIHCVLWLTLAWAERSHARTYP